MKLEELLNANVIDENEVILIIDFDGFEDVLLYKGFAQIDHIPDKYLQKTVQISALDKYRLRKYGVCTTLGIFVQD